MRIAEVYGNTCHDTFSLLYKILYDLNPELAARPLMDPGVLLELFPILVQNVSKRENRNVAVFIDELDHILEFDQRQNYEAMEILRSVFQHDRCRVFCAGFRRTMDATLRDDHPLRNFTQPLRLTGLKLKETLDMVTRPLALLEIDVPLDTATAIERETAGQPELIQICCDEIIRYFEDTNRVPSAKELLVSVFEGDIFKQSVLGAFLTNFNAYEQLACYLLFQRARGDCDRYEFNVAEIDEELKSFKLQLPLRALNTLVNNLHVGGAISGIRGSAKYRFSVPQLGRYCVSLDLDFCITKAIEDISNDASAREGALLKERDLSSRQQAHD